MFKTATAVASIARLREVLGQHFGDAEARTALLRLREHGLLPSGTHGRAGSAAITPRQAALAIISLSVDAEPIAAPAEALRVANFRLRAFDHTSDAEPGRRLVDGSAISFIDVLTGEICASAGAIPHYEQPWGWVIDRHEAAMASPERLVFLAEEQPLADCPVVKRQTVIDARLIAEIAALFAPLPAETFTAAEWDAALAVLA